MPIKDIEQKRAYGRRHYAENKDVYKARAAAYTIAQRKRLRKIVDDAKSKPCADCGGTFPVVCMDFDHAGSEKSDNVSMMVGRGLSIERVRAEIAKCDVVCSNCHRIRTHGTP